MCRGRERHSGAGVLHEVLSSFVVVSRKSMGLLKLFLLSFFFKLVFIYLRVGAHIPCLCVGQGTTFFSPHAMWDQGLELRFSSLALSAFTCEAILAPISCFY